MKTTLGLAAFAWIAFSGVGHAQPAGVTPEMIASALPEEGAPKAERGRYDVTIEPAFGATGLKVLRPTKLEGFARGDTLPVMVWGNGGCAINNPKYEGFLDTVASHGFLVVTTAGPPAPAGGPAPPRATADNLKAGIDWA